MNRIIFITWGGKGNYGRLKRSILLASTLRNEAEILFLTRCEGKTTSFIIDAGFPYIFFEDKLPEAELFIFDTEEIPGKIPENSLIIDGEGSNAIKMVPIKENGRFQILYPRYRHFHLLEKEYRKKGKKVLVALSSKHSFDEIVQAIEAVENEGLFPVFAPHYEFPKPYLSKLRERFKKIKIIGPVIDLARAFWETDIALISGRLKPFEAACLGTPSIYWETSEITEEFVREGAGVPYREGILTEFYHHPEKRREMGSRGKELVDGLGLKRILEIVRGML